MIAMNETNGDQSCVHRTRTIGTKHFLHCFLPSLASLNLACSMVFRAGLLWVCAILERGGVWWEKDIFFPLNNRNIAFSQLCQTLKGTSKKLMSMQHNAHVSGNESSADRTQSVVDQTVMVTLQKCYKDIKTS